MAFMGLMFAGILLLIIGLIVICGIVFLVIGLIIRKKHRTVSNVLFLFSGINLAVVIGVIVIMVMPYPEIIRTNDGEVKISQSLIKDYNRCLQNKDIQSLNTLLDKHPEMLYYYDVNRVMLIDYGMYNLNIEIMQCAFRHGATFDNPLSYDHLIFYNSLDSFFDRIDYPKQDKEILHHPGVTNDEIIHTVKFAIEHGAKLNYHNNTDNGYQNFYEEAAEWVKRDDFVTVQETEWLNYLFQELQEETKK